MLPVRASFCVEPIGGGDDAAVLSMTVSPRAGRLKPRSGGADIGNAGRLHRRAQVPVGSAPAALDPTYMSCASVSSRGVGRLKPRSGGADIANAGRLHRAQVPVGPAPTALDPTYTSCASVSSRVVGRLKPRSGGADIGNAGRLHPAQVPVGSAPTALDPTYMSCASVSSRVVGRLKPRSGGADIGNAGRLHPAQVLSPTGWAPTNKRLRSPVGAHPVGELSERSSMRAFAPNRLSLATIGQVRQAARPRRSRASGCRSSVSG
jgi:streptogramin lyase